MRVGNLSSLCSKSISWRILWEPFGLKTFCCLLIKNYFLARDFRSYQKRPNCMWLNKFTGLGLRRLDASRADFFFKRLFWWPEEVHETIFRWNHNEATSLSVKSEHFQKYEKRDPRKIDHFEKTCLTIAHSCSFGACNLVAVWREGCKWLPNNPEMLIYQRGGGALPH